MPPARYRRPALRRPAQGPASLGPEPAPAPAPISNNELVQEFIRTYIEKVRDQAPASLAASIPEAKDNTNRPLKPRNPNLYYDHSHEECYYFCQ